MQLCAEAMCLEDMLACSIPEGALFYQQTKHRERVQLDDELRKQVVVMTQQMHELYRRGHAPKVRVSKTCKACSLRELCLPQLMKKNRSVRNFIDEMVCGPNS